MNKNSNIFIDCTECKKSISKSAYFCPHCGAETRRIKSIRDGFIVSFSILAVLVGFIVYFKYLYVEEVDYLDGSWKSFGDKVSSDINKKIIYDKKSYIKYRFNANKTCSIIFYENGKEINAVTKTETPVNIAIYENCTYEIKDDYIRIDYEDGSGESYTFEKDNDILYIDGTKYNKLTD